MGSPCERRWGFPTSGRLVARSSPRTAPLSPPSQTGDRDFPPPRTPGGDEPMFFTRKVAGQQLRIIYQPIVGDGEVIGSVEVAPSLKETDDALGEIRNIFIVGGLAALFLT